MTEKKPPKKWKWACPQCGVDHTGKHRTAKQREECISRGMCGGFVCECDGDAPKGHGDSPADPCENAYCYHCGWGGMYPPRPKKLAAWEKKALHAGWTPPPGWGGQPPA